MTQRGLRAGLSTPTVPGLHCQDLLHCVKHRNPRKWSWTTFWWIFPSGQEMVEKWSENGPRETAYITQWSKNGRKMVPGRPQTIFGILFDHFLTIFLQIEGAAFGRPPKGGGGLRPPPPLGVYLVQSTKKILPKYSWEYFLSIFQGVGIPLGVFFEYFLEYPQNTSKY